MTEQNTPQETTTEATIHPMTRKAVDASLAKKAISPDSHKAVLAGELSLEEARSLGRNAGPSGPAVRVDKNDRSRSCLCGCQGTSKTGRFVAGHDQRMVTYAKEYVRGERELTQEQAEYVQTSGKLDRARAQVEKEERKRQEKVEVKAQKQREKEGEAEKVKVKADEK